MTPAGKTAIDQRAKAAGITVTDYLTTCALGKEIVRVDGLELLAQDSQSVDCTSVYKEKNLHAA